MILNQLKYNVGNAARVLRAKSGFIVNNKIIQFCGLQRSGNHAVINWIIGQEFSKTCFINGVFPGANPWLKNWGVSYPNYPYWPKDRDVRGAFVSKDIVICSYENREIEKISRDSDLLPKYFGNSRESYSLIILRDPYNTFASWFQKNWTVTPEIIKLWKSYAYEFIGVTNYLKSPKISVSFNKWFLDQSYRQRLAESLGLRFTDRNLNSVSFHGGGSSFDEESLNKKAQEMNILNRFHNYLGDAIFLQIFENDPELGKLSKDIFGSIDMSC